MRLSNRLKKIIKQSIFDSFGEVNIYLFGSRVDGTKKGGDIDIAIDVNISTEKFKQCKIQFFLSLMRFGYDFKIDIVPYKNNDKLLTAEIKKNALKL
jgi:predicted nucleotidyltransferase